MPKVTIAVECDLDIPADVVAADNLLNFVRGATHPLAQFSRDDKIDAEAPPGGSTAPEAEPAVPQAPETAAPPDRATELEAIGQAARARTRKPKPPTDIEVKDHKGERVASFLHPADAAARMVHEVSQLTTVEDITAFGKANADAMNFIAGKDKEAANKAGMAIAAHVQTLKESPAVPPTPLVGDAAPGTPTSSPSTADTSSGPTAPTSASPSSFEDQLAALFGKATVPALFGKATVPAVEAKPMDRDEFLKEMVAIGRQLGAQEGQAWMEGQGFHDVLSIPAEKYAPLVASGKARVEELRAKAA